jgi:hypothetical protein
MVSIQKYAQSGNYIEVVLLDDDTMSMGDSVFFKLMHDVKNKNLHCFQKYCKEYVHRNKFYENNDKSQIRVFKKTLSETQVVTHGSNQYRVLAYYKEKLPYHAFPSTTMMHSISYVIRSTFKINNRVFLNFERRMYKDAPRPFNKVYINYNHDDNVDVNNIDTAVQAALDIIS